jgi:LuxR family maltose regulon positive regulatory protein
VLMIDRYWEEAYRLMMISHARRGNRPLALRAYEQCQRALNEGLGLQPMPGTTELYDRIARGDPLPVP